MDTYSIRPVALDDIAAIQHIALHTWKFTYGAVYPEPVIEQFVSQAYSVKSLTASIHRDCKRVPRLFHVALDEEGHVVAFSHVVPNPHRDATFELARIYALPNTHGTGVGSGLLNHLLETLPNLRELTAWVEQENHIGRHFYERHEFRAIDEKEEDLLGHKTTLLKYVLTPLCDGNEIRDKI